MRIQNSVMNIFFGISGQLISIIMSFSVRTVFIYTLGIEYLGVDGLFTSILMMLSLANLGFDTAMIYSLYKPLAEKNQFKIQALMNLYRKAYRLIGIIVLLIGLLLIPFLSDLMNGTTNIENIHIIYILFLINSAASYFFIYKQSVIIADQRNYIISKIHSVYIILSNIIQILILITVESYIAVLSVQVIFRIVENIHIAKMSGKLYPFLIEKNNSKLSKRERKDFFANLYSLMLYKISGVVINGTDNIIISFYIGITAVGVYSNYLLIIATLSTFLGYIFYSVTASVGNLIVTEGSEKKYFIFRVINFSNFWIYGFCVVSLWNLINPFITLWLGEQYIFNKFVVFAIILNFYTTGMQNASTTFRETTGLFKKGKYRPIVAAGINIAFSIILAKQIGIAGIFLGTVISRLCTYFWYDPYIIFKYVFQKPVKVHFIKYILFTFIVLIASLITDLIASNIIFHYPLVNFVVRGILCIIIPNLIVYIFFRKTEEFIYLMTIIKQITNKIFNKVMLKNNSYNV